MKPNDKPLSSEDRKRLLQELIVALRQIAVARGRSVQGMMAGNTGVGKSTALTLFAGGKLIRKALDPEFDPAIDGPLSELPDEDIMFVEDLSDGRNPIASIGENISQSHTLKPSLVENKVTRLSVFDTAGFLENRSRVEAILAALGLRMAIKTVRGLSTLMITVTYGSIALGKEGPFLPLLSTLRGIIRSPESLSPENNPSGAPIIFVVTKIPKDKGMSDVKKAITRIKRSLEATDIYKKAHNYAGKERLGDLTAAEREQFEKIAGQLESLAFMNNEEGIFPLYLEDGRKSADKILQHLNKREGQLIPREAFNLTEAGDAQFELIKLLESIANEPFQSVDNVACHGKKQSEIVKRYLQLSSNLAALRRRQFSSSADLQAARQELEASENPNTQTRLAQIIANREEQIARKKKELVGARKQQADLRSKKVALEREHGHITSEDLVPGWSDSVDEERWPKFFAPWGYTRKDFVYNNTVGMPFDNLHATCKNGKFHDEKKNDGNTSYTGTYKSEYCERGIAQVDVQFKANRLESNITRAGIIKDQDIPNAEKGITDQEVLISRLPGEIQALEIELRNARAGTFPETQARMSALEEAFSTVLGEVDLLKKQLSFFSLALANALPDYHLVLKVAECIDFSGSGYLSDFVRELHELVDLFSCPISLELMERPVVLPACGHTVEEEKMLQWRGTQRNHSDSCVLCKTPLGHQGWIPADDTLKSLIQNYRDVVVGLERLPMPEILGLQRRNVERDGHCLFRSVLEQIPVTDDRPEDVQQLRNRIADAMQENTAELRNFPDGDEVNFEQRVADIRTTDTWGGHLEIAVMARIFNLHIVLAEVNKPTHIFGAETGLPVFLFYDGRHYDRAEVLPELTAGQVIQRIRVDGRVIDHGDMVLHEVITGPAHENRGAARSPHALLAPPQEANLLPEQSSPAPASNNH